MSAPRFFGLLPVWKPVGETSRKTLNRLQRHWRERRLGHTGTLDPFAEGLLLVLLGSATRLVPYLEGARKEYEAVLELGSETDTLDLTGQVVRECPVPALDEGQVRAAVLSFLGSYTHTVPLYSAVHHVGQRLYDLARAGRTDIEPPSRTTEIFAIELLEWLPPGRIRFRAEVSSGTYIRSLGRDLAERLGTCGHLSALTRTRIGSITREQAREVEQLDKYENERMFCECHCLEALLEALSSPPLCVTPEVLRDLRHGKLPEVSGLAAPESPQLRAVASAAGELLAVAQLLPGAGTPRLQPLAVFPPVDADESADNEQT